MLFRSLSGLEVLPDLVRTGVASLKIEGRLKSPEYVASITRVYRQALDRVMSEITGAAPAPGSEPARAKYELEMSFSRGLFTGWFRGIDNRELVHARFGTKRGVFLGTVERVAAESASLHLESALRPGDGVVFDRGRPEEGEEGGRVYQVNVERDGLTTVRFGHGDINWRRVQAGQLLWKTSDPVLEREVRATFAGEKPAFTRPIRLEVHGTAGTPLTLLADDGAGHVARAESSVPLSVATSQPLTAETLRAQLGRLGGTPYVLSAVDARGLAPGLFLPVSELNHLRQDATAALMERRGWAHEARAAERAAMIASLVVPHADAGPAPRTVPFTLTASVWRVDDATAAVDAGATEVVFDPFIRHPVPPRARVVALRDALAERGVSLRLRTPSVVRPEDRRVLEPWLATGLPLLTGHLGLLAESGAAGRDVVADYATNTFNPHTARELFRLGAHRITPSIELTAAELEGVVSPWGGAGFDVLVYGRTEGMTIEHCVLSAAFDRQPTTCRDLCVKSHTNVELTDPAGYVFPVATDSDCRNRLLHSRPIDGSAYLGRLWAAGIRGFTLVFNLPDDRVGDVVRAFRAQLDSLAAGERPEPGQVRAVVGDAYTRGHFERAV